MGAVFDRIDDLCSRLGIAVPILLAPMAGAGPPALSISVAKAGGLGACGALMMDPDEIAAWCDRLRSVVGDAFQLNTWVWGPSPTRDAGHEATLRDFLASWGPPVPETAGSAVPPGFEAQVEAMIDARPRAISSVMGLFAPKQINALKSRGIFYLATVTTVAEAKQAAAAGADMLIAQGAEAGGHRGAFDPHDAERRLVGTFALVPAVVDSTGLPVIAAGGIADGRTAAAALLLGASAVQIGTAFLKCPESGISASWRAALDKAAPEDTVISRVFSGRPGRSLITDFVRAAISSEAPAPAPYPVQRGLTASMREHAQQHDSLAGLQAWAGQSAKLAKTVPASELTATLWCEASELLRSP